MTNKHWSVILYEGDMIGMHGTLKDEFWIDNFDEWEFHKFMEEEGLNRHGFFWHYGEDPSTGIRYHTEHRVDRHFITKRVKRGGEWIYDESWNSLDEFKKYINKHTIDY